MMMLAVDIGGQTGPNYPAIAVLGIAVAIFVILAVRDGKNKKPPRHS